MEYTQSAIDAALSFADLQADDVGKKSYQRSFHPKPKAQIKSSGLCSQFRLVSVSTSIASLHFAIASDYCCLNVKL